MPSPAAPGADDEGRLLGVDDVVRPCVTRRIGERDWIVQASGSGSGLSCVEASEKLGFRGKRGLEAASD